MGGNKYEQESIVSDADGGNGGRPSSRMRLIQHRNGYGVQHGSFEYRGGNHSSGIHGGGIYSGCIDRKTDRWKESSDPHHGSAYHHSLGYRY